jgi:hypothetical protein
MTATVFREQLKMHFRIKLTPGELAALMREFGRDNGSGAITIDGANFTGRFSALGRQALLTH